VRSLLNLILEAPLDDNTAKKMLDSGKQVSIYYQGDDTNPKGWRKIEVFKVSGTGDEKVLVAYEVPKESSKKPELKKFVQKKITNWNLLGTANTVTVKRDTKKVPDKKAAVTPPPKPLPPNLSKLGELYCEAIVNKRYVRMYYKGDKEEAPGWRLGVRPVCYGVRDGINYVSAWVGAGKSVSADNDSGKSLPGWRFFREDRIDKWEVEGEKTFNKPPASNFNPTGDKRLEKCTCISDFEPDKAAGALQESQILPSILEAINIF
jgi:hypothetical protein